jgi:signal transduction histidine kinase
LNMRPDTGLDRPLNQTKAVHLSRHSCEQVLGNSSPGPANHSYIASAHSELSGEDRFTRLCIDAIRSTPSDFGLFLAYAVSIFGQEKSADWVAVTMLAPGPGCEPLHYEWQSDAFLSCRNNSATERCTNAQSATAPPWIKTLASTPLLHKNTSIGSLSLGYANCPEHWDGAENARFKLMAELLISVRTRIEDDLCVRAANQALLQSRDFARQAISAARHSQHSMAISAASAIHAARQSIKSLLAVAELGLTNTGKPDLLTLLRSAVTAGTRSYAQINGALNALWSDPAELAIDHEPFLITQLVDDLYQNFANIAALKNLAFDIHIQPGIPQPLLGAPKIIQIILGNLISNAIQFTDIGGVTLNIRQTAGQSDGRAEYKGSRLIFEVIDSGTGIAERDLPLIMSPPSQRKLAHAAAQRIGAASGLYIARCLANSTGGDIRIQSTQHQGTVIIFETGLDVAVSN